MCSFFVFRSFSQMTVWLCIFLAKKTIGAKAVHKMLVKLTTGARNFQSGSIFLLSLASHHLPRRIQYAQEVLL
jgi:hypothetical protein